MRIVTKLQCHDLIGACSPASHLGSGGVEAALPGCASSLPRASQEAGTAQHGGAAHGARYGGVGRSVKLMYGDMGVKQLEEAFRWKGC